MELAFKLAHELKAPLLILETKLKRLADSSAPDPELARQCLADVREARLLIVQLLEAARAPNELTDRDALDSVDTSAVLATTAERMDALAKAKGLSVSTRAAPNVGARGERQAIERIVASLLDNAIKFSSPGSTIRLSSRMVENNVELIVEDDGIGLAPTDRAQVFEPFFRVDRERDGFGLGLAIAHSLARAMGGTLRAESELGHGCTFTLSLPKA